MAAAVVGGMSSVGISASGEVSREEAMAPFDAILQKEVRADHFYKVSSLRALLDTYSAAELQLIYRDFCERRIVIFATATKGCLDYVVTAGGPASGKSTFLEEFLRTKKRPDQPNPENIQRVYVDPDRSCMQKMSHTCFADIISGVRTPEEAYEHWRAASNFLSNVFLAIALDQGYAIAHGSTMATPQAKAALEAIKGQYGYRVTVLNMTCTEDIRRRSEDARRALGVVQCTPKDFVEKHALFLSLLPIYIQTAHTVFLCHRQAFDQSVWAAKISAEETMRIYDASAVDAIQDVYDRVQGEGWFDSIIFSDLMTTATAELGQGEPTERRAHPLSQVASV